MTSARAPTPIHIGVVLPQGRLMLGREALTAFVEAAQDLDYEYVLSFDHVLGADPSHYDNGPLPYTIAVPFHEVFTTFSYVAGKASRLGLCTGVLVLPQRQTALVAKQAAEVDLLSGGRLRLGVGSGWNKVEYDALGTSWNGRGARLDEQIEVLRMLWTQPSVSYSGAFHSFRGAGINPLPIQRPIPIWIGGGSPIAMRRAALAGDGYMVPGHPPLDPSRSQWPEVFSKMHELRRSHIGDGANYGIEIRPIVPNVDEWKATVCAWQEVGVSHIAITTLGARRGDLAQRAEERRQDLLTTVDDHIAELEQVRVVLSDILPGNTA